MVEFAKIIAVICMSAMSTECMTSQTEIALNQRTVSKVCKEYHKRFLNSAKKYDVFLREFRCFPAVSKRKV